MADWTKVVVGVTAAAGGAALLCYLLNAEDEARAAPAEAGAESGAKGSKFDEVTKEQVEQILQEILSSQEKMKGHMKELTKELLQKSLSFEQTYHKVKSVQPEDPLEKHGLSMMDFDRLLDKFQSDPNVRRAIAQIMGTPSPSSVTPDRVKAISVKNIIDVHTFMLQELEKLQKYFGGIRDRSSYDLKTVTIAAQALVGAKVEEKFSITSEDIEGAVLMHHTQLATDQEFANINIQIQTTMGKLMGSPLPAS